MPEDLRSRPPDARRPPLNRPGPLAILCNPQSGWVRRRAERARGALRALAPGRYREASEPERIGEAALELAREPDVTLCVAGGDGSLHAVLTALHRELPTEAWPVLAPIPMGSTNMSAKDLGIRGSPMRRLAALEAWAAGDADGRVIHRPAVRVEEPNGTARCGMFFGAGAVANGVSFLRDNLYQKGVPEATTSALSIAWVLWKMARGEDRARSMVTAVEGEVDGRAIRSDATAMCLVTSLDRLILGSRPYWGREGGPLHVTLVSRDAPHFWLSVPRVAIGRPGKGFTPDRGFHSYDAERVTLRFDGRYVIDGELYEASREAGAVELSTIPEVEWLVA